MPHAPAALLASFDALDGVVRDDALAAWPTRDDDLAQLRTALARLERRYTLAIVGEFSSGKSYLLNALLGKIRHERDGRIAGLLATDINPSTATITELEYGMPEGAVATFPSGRSERVALDGLSRFTAVAKDGRGALHDATADDDAAPAFVVVSVDSPFLQSGFVVADTPGLASPNPAHRRATLAYLPRTDAVLYLIDTQQPFSEGDAAFLGLIGEHVGTIFIVQTKIDLWRMPESDGREAWEGARARIVERAARFAPGAEVFAVSARDYAAGTLDADGARAEHSGFPALLAGLERSLEARARAARIARAASVARDIAVRTASRVRRAAALAETEPAALDEQLAIASSRVLERERKLSRERDEVVRAGAERRDRIVEAGGALGERIVRALAGAIDVADIERVRDRGRFGGVVDATVAPIWTAFAHDVAGHVARALEQTAKSRSDLRVADLAAARMGGEAGTGAWSRDLASGIASSIVLGAIGGPTVDFAHGVARNFAAHPHGAYMKRELGSDLGATLFPALERDVRAFVEGIASQVAGTYDDVAAAIERERSVARAETLEPIERARALAADPDAKRAAAAALAAVDAKLGDIEAQLAQWDGRDATSARGPHTVPASAASADTVPFDADAYDRGLRPERYRVVVLGALRRGKSSLINAIAGTRLLHDDAGSEARFPVHVRYGDRERAYALEREGVWCEIPTAEAMAHAARSPVLIETPWSMPRQLVLVHAPAFDSGFEEAETIDLAAARNASEILGLFSRQLSDRELALYARVADFGVPMLLAHTIADNESASERRTVVELAGRYVRERGIAVARIFTISALDSLEAAQTKRPAAAWNELAALRETLHAHAEEHMHKLAERERLAAPAPAVATAAVASEPNLRRALGRLFGRGR